ncbi:MAG: flagellar motor protein MotB [Terracidiphilus sp.]|jgi:chemotaxis protein MotB
MVDDERIIIVKKSAGHAGHHGGAWKVAYADFVTALMALFIVLWLMNSSKPIQEAVGGYFRDPNGTGQKKGTQLGGAGDAGPLKQQDMSKLKEDLMKSMSGLKDFDKLKKLIEMTITPEGLRIELMEDPKGTFFENGSAQPTPVLQNLVKILADQIGKLPNPISIEGHTDSKPYADSTYYSNWELSTDRANTARRLMENNGLHPGQVVQVRGYADHNLRKPLQPYDASNRRVSLIIQYVLNPPEPPVVISNGTLPSIPAPDGAATPAGKGPTPTASKP